MSAATKQARARLEGRLDWLRDILDYVEEYVGLPDPVMPTYTASGLDLNVDEIETKAAEPLATSGGPDLQRRGCDREPRCRGRTG